MIDARPGFGLVSMDNLGSKLRVIMEPQPYMLLRLDWLQAVRTWLEWSRAQMTPAHIPTAQNADGSPLEGEQLTQWLNRCIEELDELLRVWRFAVAGSPMVYMRSLVPAQEEAGPPMPPREAGEKGN